MINLCLWIVLLILFFFTPSLFRFRCLWTNSSRAAPQSRWVWFWFRPWLGFFFFLALGLSFLARAALDMANLFWQPTPPACLAGWLSFDKPDRYGTTRWARLKHVDEQAYTQTYVHQIQATFMTGLSAAVTGFNLMPIALVVSFIFHFVWFSLSPPSSLPFGFWDRLLSPIEGGGRHRRSMLVLSVCVCVCVRARGTLLRSPLLLLW